MVRTKFDPRVVRPTCPQHPGSTIRLDGYKTAKWSDAHRRPRYRCVVAPKTRGHVLFLPVSVRQPTAKHPDSGQACASCEHVYERHEGPKTGHDFVFAHQEIARLFLRVGEGMSLRDVSREMRSSVFRVNQRDRSKPRQKTIRSGQTSKQAGLAINYLDAYAAGVIEALHPREWPRVLLLDSTTLTTKVMRPVKRDGAGTGGGQAPEPDEEEVSLKAGTILIAMDPTGREVRPCLIRAAGGKEIESWKEFLGTLSGTPEWVIADLDSAIARAVRETWPTTILFHSRHHIAELMRKRAVADGVPTRVRLDEPVRLARPLPWTGSTERKFGDHPLFAALSEAQRGPEEWAAFLTLIEEHVPSDRLELRSWIATNEVLIARQWRIVEDHGRVPLSTGALEGKIVEWLAPLRRRAGRWQNARRLNLALGLITLRGRGEAREARYAKLVRTQFEARTNLSHLPSENTLPMETRDNKTRQMSWWRTWHDRDRASLPALVAESTLRVKRRKEDAHLAWARERLQRLYDEQAGRNQLLGIPSPPKGRQKNPAADRRGSGKGKFLRDYPDLLDEWDWDANGNLDPMSLTAGTKTRAAWRCLLNPDHVWETRVADRTTKASYCPFHMGNRVHPSESLAAYYPHLAAQWHPTKNQLRPNQVSHASAREIHWVCALGHEWPAVVYQRTRSRSECPECDRAARPARAKAAATKAREAAHEREEKRLDAILDADEDLI